MCLKGRCSGPSDEGEAVCPGKVPEPPFTHSEDSDGLPDGRW